MGTSYQLIVAGFSLYSEKSEVEPWIMSIFRESDRQVFERKSSEAIGWVHSGDDYLETAYIYSSNVENIKQRLEVMGYSLKNIEQEFTSAVNEHLENVEKHRAQRTDLPEPEILLHSTFNDWLEAFKFILQTDIQKKVEPPKNVRDIVGHLPSTGSIDFEIFPCNHFFSFLRVYLEACPDQNAQVYLDISLLGCE